MIDSSNISEYSSKILAVKVVVYRALGIDKQEAVLCMQELAARRLNGDTFEYEIFIENELNKFPKSKSMNLTNIIKGIGNTIR